MSDIKQNWGFWKTAFIYGLPVGLLMIGMMIGSFTLFGFHSGAVSMAVGFLLMFLIFSLVFFGIKRFRDRDQGGFIKFTKALLLGFAMSLIAGLAYVFVSEIYTAMTNSVFIGKYADHLIELEKAKGVSAEALSTFMAKMDAMKTNYGNPLYRMSWTFTEVFPMGLIVSLISALALHNPKLWAKN